MENPVKSAQINYFEEMRNLGVKPTIKWICGKVELRKNRNEHSLHPEVVFITATGEYLLFLDEKDIFDKRLLNLEGKAICAKGILEAEKFIMSDWNIYNHNKEKGEKHMIRYNPKQVLLFEVGDKVRNRRRAMAFEQVYGKVEKIKDQLMYIKRDGVEDLEVFDLDDSVSIYAILEKV